MEAMNHIKNSLTMMHKTSQRPSSFYETSLPKFLICKEFTTTYMTNGRAVKSSIEQDKLVLQLTYIGTLVFDKFWFLSRHESR